MALGQLVHRRRHLQKSEAYLRQGLQMYADVLPQNHQEVARAKSTLGTVLLEKSNYAAARPLLLTAENAFDATTGTSHPHTLKNRRALIRLYDAWDQPQQAAAWRDSLRTVQSASVTSHNWRSRSTTGEYDLDFYESADAFRGARGCMPTAHLRWRGTVLLRVRVF